jgi:hypothetical protein
MKRGIYIWNLGEGELQGEKSRTQQLQNSNKNAQNGSIQGLGHISALKVGNSGKRIIQMGGLCWEYGQ